MRSFVRSFVLLLLVSFAATPLAAFVEDLRISEVNPTTDTVEVWNSATSTTTLVVDAFFNYRNVAQTIPTGTTWAAGEYKTFVLAGGGLNDSVSDVWIYRTANYSTASELVHGVKYGASTIVGRESIAVSAGKWPSTTTFTPTPGSGQTLAWDLFGYTQYDWYVDATPTLVPPGPNTTPAGAVADTLAWPGGVSSFDNIPLGDDVTALQNWVLVDTGTTPGVYTVRCVNDTTSELGMRPAGTTKWMRIRDANIVDQNRFYTPTITAAAMMNTYSWTWYINLEQPIAGAAANKPKFVIQHDNGGFFNAWGIQITDTSFNLVVLGAGATPAGIGGTDASTSIANVIVGQWVKLDLSINFDTNTLSGSVNNGTAATLPVSLTGNKLSYRFCYRGEGTDNAATILLDDVSTSGTVGVAPVVAVTSNSVAVTNGGTINTPAGSTLASLGLSIAVSDADAFSTVSVVGDVSNVTTEGIVNGQFSSGVAVDPYTLAPTSGIFNVQSVNHLVTLTATDNQGNQFVFTFTIAVAASAMPTFTVTTGILNVGPGSTINTPAGSTLASLLLAITVSDADPGSTVTLSGTVSNVTTQGILNSEFSNASAADPYTINPSTGVFNVHAISHTVMLTATDNFGTIGTFQFTISVATSVAPVITVSRNLTTVANASTLGVLAGSTLAALSLTISVDDGDPGSAVTLVGTVANASFEGILNSEFSSTSAADPYTRNPVSGTFSVGSVTLVVTLTATDNFGVSGNFTFSIAVGTATPPVITVTHNNGLPVADGATLEVQQGATLVSLLLTITVSDVDPSSTVTLVGTISNVTTQGMPNSQFGSAATADPYAVVPITGKFTVANVTHIVTLSATDNLALTGNFTFNIHVVPKSGNSATDGGGCVSATGAESATVPMVAFLGALILRRRRRRNAK